MPSPDPLTLPLGQRLMESFKAFLGVAISPSVDPDGRLEAARHTLIAIVFRRRDEDTVITPEGDADKEPRLLCTAVDEGRYKPYTPIRNFRLELSIRANALVPNGQSDAFHVACGALETLLDGLNLQIALTSSTWKVAVMLGVREPGCHFTTEPKGDKAVLRRQSYALKIRAVGLEHTV